MDLESPTERIMGGQIATACGPILLRDNHLLLLIMIKTLLRFSRLTTSLALISITGLASCDKNGQSGVMQHPPGNKGLKGIVTPNKAYGQMFDATTTKLSDTTYLIITKAERGSVFTVHTGPLPASDHAVCFASTNNPGFRECVEEYYQNAGGVAVQSNEAGWWATPL